MMMKTLLAACGLLAAGAHDASARKDHCYGLALSGGGSKGAYEAGVLWGFYHGAKDKTKYQYDVVTGVSAGAINGAAIAMFAPGDEEKMVEFLSSTW